MNRGGGQEDEPRRLPLVAVVSSVPMLCEGLSLSLEGIAEVQSFPAGRGDMAGLLRSLRPDAVVVDRETEADEAADFARETDSPLVFVSYRDERLRVLRGGEWEDPQGSRPSPEAIRNVLVGGLFGRVGRGAPTS